MGSLLAWANACAPRDAMHQPTGLTSAACLRGAQDMPQTAAASRRWPDLYYRFVPELHVADDAARAVRSALLGNDETALLDAEGLCRLGDFVAEEADLGVDAGGDEAMMFPGSDGRFHIRIDARPYRGCWNEHDPGLRTELARQRFRFRLAHEIAHSFFFRREGSRLTRERDPSTAEERFCDEFARCLLVPTCAAKRYPVTADSVVDLHAAYDVSIEVAARALARAHNEATVLVAYWPTGEPCVYDALQLQWLSQQSRQFYDHFFHAKTVILAVEEGSATCRERSPLTATATLAASARRVPEPRRQVVAVYEPA